MPSQPITFQPTTSAFTIWLSTQTDRQDRVGRFARYALAEPTFPFHYCNMHHFIDWVSLEHRNGLKKAHKEWRLDRNAKRRKRRALLKADIDRRVAEELKKRSEAALPKVNKVGIRGVTHE